MEIIERLHNIIFVGDLGTGKTSIIKRYVQGIFSTNYKQTIGLDFASKVFHLGTRISIKQQIWEIGGQEIFGNMTRVYYKEVLGAFIVFDVTRLKTYEAVKIWKSDIDTKVTNTIPVVLLANKIDMVTDKFGWGKTKEEMDKFCEEHDFVAWFETSAKNNTGIDEAVCALVESISKNETSSTYVDDVDDPNKIKLVAGNTRKDQHDDKCY